MLSTGRYSTTQIISLLTSVMSLSWGASRSFMIMRPAGKADPDPEATTLLFRIWPYMLVFSSFKIDLAFAFDCHYILQVVTVADLAILVFMAGLMGVFIFVAQFLGFIATYGILTALTRKKVTKGEGGEFEIACGKSEVNQEEKNKDESFLFVASVCSTWIPSVVGHEEHKVFLIAG